MAVELTRLCQAMHVLPRAGGVLDQDSYHIYMIQTVLAAQAEKDELDRKRNASMQTARS